MRFIRWEMNDHFAIFGCFSQNCSRLLKLSRWHLQTLRPIVSSPDRCGFNTNSSLFLAQASFYIDSIWFRHFAETRLCALQLSILTNVYISCLPCPRQLSRYSSHAANGKLASFSAASCWCGVIWIWWYQRHSTACDDADSDSVVSWNFRYYRIQWGIFAFWWFLSDISATRGRIHTKVYLYRDNVCRRAPLWSLSAPGAGRRS